MAAPSAPSLPLSPSPARAHVPQDLRQSSPRPPPTLELPLDPRPAPSWDLRARGRPGLPGLGSRPRCEFPQKDFVWDSAQIDSRRDRLPYTYPRAGRSRGSAYPRAEPEPRRRGPEPLSGRQPPTIPYAAPPGDLSLGRPENVGEIEAKDGLPSADRNNKATLLLTGPFRTAKSSAKDLTPLVLKLQYAKYRGPLRGPRRNRLLRH